MRTPATTTDMRGPQRAIVARIAKTKSAVSRIAMPLTVICLITANHPAAFGQQPGRTMPTKSQAGRTELRDMARRRYELSVRERDFSMATTEDICRWSRHWLDQELALASTDQSKAIALRAHLERMQHLAREEFRHIETLEYYLTEAELMLAECIPDPKFEAAVAARKALQGTWQVVSEEKDGVPLVPPDQDKVEIAGRRIEFTGGVGVAWGFLTIDATAVPAKLDFFGFNEDFGFGGRGIYKLKEDQFTLCLTDTENRPRGFSTHQDDGNRLYVLERKPQDNNQARPLGCSDE